MIGNAAVSDGKPLAAARAFEEAEEADPDSPEPAEHLAELYFQIWQGSRRPRDFERAALAGKLAVKGDPASYAGYRRLGEMSAQRASIESSPEEAGRAVEYFSKAVERYPNYAPLRAERASAFQLAGDRERARDEAKTALELDQINRAAGHRDKFLPDDVVRKLEDLAK